jgi:hypothetical protein
VNARGWSIVTMSPAYSDALKGIQAEARVNCTREDLRVHYAKSACLASESTQERLADRSKISPDEKVALSRVRVAYAEINAKIAAAHRQYNPRNGKAMATSIEAFKIAVDKTQESLFLFTKPSGKLACFACQRVHSKTAAESFGPVRRTKTFSGPLIVLMSGGAVVNGAILEWEQYTLTSIYEEHMATPRVFVSSTWYDLRYIRENLKFFIRTLGYDPVLSEEGTIFYDPRVHVQDARLTEIPNCQLFILVIGGRYGTSFKDSERSVTNTEYMEAVRHKIPIFALVVLADYQL